MTKDTPKPGDDPTTAISRPPSTDELPDLEALSERNREQARKEAQRAETGYPGPVPQQAPGRAGVAAVAAQETPSVSGGQRPGPGGAPRPARSTTTMAAAPQGEPLTTTMQLRHIDPWTTFKVAGVISLALFVVWIVAVGVLYLVLSFMGVWERINGGISDFVSSSGGGELISVWGVFGTAGLVGLVNIVLFTALATLSVMIYNYCVDLVGGVQVTLEDLAE